MSVNGVIRYPGRHMGWVIPQSRGRDGMGVADRNVDPEVGLR